MAPAKEKTLTIQINSMGTGPNGVPLLCGAPNAPAVISGNVLVSITDTPFLIITSRT